MNDQPQVPPSRRSFGLRAKLALGFGALLAIQLAFGLANVRVLGRLGGAIDVILRENYRSVVACERMKEALERMDSGALFSLAGEPEEGRRLAAENAPRFAAALEIELGNITLPGEGASAERLRALYGAYLPVLRRVQTAGIPLEERRALYFRDLYPTFREIKATAGEILEMNQRNMVEANDRARALAAAASRRLALLLVASFALASLCVALLSRAILRPLAALTHAVGEIGKGRLGAQVPVTSGDEVGELGSAFNTMAEGLRRREAAARLRAASHWERGGRDLEPRPVPAKDLVREALAEAAAAYDEEGVALEGGAVDPALRVLADPERVDFVFKALLRNALAHSPEGGRVAVAAEPQGPRVRFTVRDEGPGVPLAERERIFEPLYQISGTEDLGVAGLGLTLARDVVRSHGGEIGCAGGAETGATFWFTLPSASGNL